MLNKERSSFLKEYKENKLNEIFLIISSYTFFSDGITQQHLADILRMNKRSIDPYKKQLLEKDWIKINKEAKIVAKLDERVRYPMLNAGIITRSFSYLLMESGNKSMILTNKNIEYTDKNGKLKAIDLPNHKELFNTSFTNQDILEKSLFEFSNQIGAFIVYTILNAMNTDNHNNHGIWTKLVIEKMVKKSLDSIVPYLFKKFFKICSEVNIVEVDQEYMARSKSNDIDDGMTLISRQRFFEIYKAFTRLYPTLTFEFEKSLKKRYSFAEQLNAYEPVEEFEERNYLKSIDLHNLRLKCEHKFKRIPPSEKNDKIVLSRCIKCDIVKKKSRKHLSVRKSNS